MVIITAVSVGRTHDGGQNRIRDGSNVLVGVCRVSVSMSVGGVVLWAVEDVRLSMNLHQLLLRRRLLDSILKRNRRSKFVTKCVNKDNDNLQITSKRYYHRLQI
jgi:hypothetical protein